jgi:hypothetical protein
VVVFVVVGVRKQLHPHESLVASKTESGGGMPILPLGVPKDRVTGLA